MRLPGGPADTAILSTILFPIFAAAVGSINCALVIAGKDRTLFDLHELGGPRSVVHRLDEGPSYTNTTYTIDICKTLGKAKNVPADDQCPNGTRLCAIQHQISEDGSSNILKTVFPIAGELIEKGGGNLDSKWQLLKESTSHDDSTKEGLTLEMNGGFKAGEDGKKRKQKAIVEFLCDKDRTGLEHLPTPQDPYEDAKIKRADDENSDGEKSDDGAPSLEFLRYDTDGSDADILRLLWRTKHACESETLKGEHWGLFTWFLIITFMSTASYLIFGSWLNYNRYGARGWDLLPHGDTIRDIPYLLKDWFRRVLNTVEGGGSRGGYAAV